MPTPLDDGKFIRHSAKAYKLRKASFLNRIVPISLVPVATTNTLLIMGSNKTLPVGSERSCSYPLPLLLLLTGVVSMGIIIMGVTARYIVDWIFENRFISRTEKRLIVCLEYTTCALTGIQISMLTVTTCLLFYMMPNVQTANKFGEHYCEHGIVIFSSVLMSVTWVFLIVALGAYFYITFVSTKKAKQEAERVHALYILGGGGQVV